MPTENPPQLSFDVTTLSDAWAKDTLDAMIAAISPRIVAALNDENSAAFTEIVEPHLEANIVPAIAPMLGQVIRHAVDFHCAKAIKNAVFAVGERLDVLAHDGNGRIVQTMKTPVLYALRPGPKEETNAK